MDEPLTETEAAEIAIDIMTGWLDSYVSRNDGTQIQFRLMDDGVWYVDASDGIRAKGELGKFKITVTAEAIA